MKEYSLTTRNVHIDRKLNRPEHGAIHSSTANSVLYGFEDAQDIVDVFQGKKMGHVYGRSSSSTVTALQTMINDLEAGVGAVCFATGMSAISSSFLSLFKQGDHLIVSQYLFGNTRSFLASIREFGIEISYVDITSMEEIEKARQANTVALFTEVIANPVTQVADIGKIGDYCEQEQILFMVDNTMSPPPLFTAKSAKVGLIFNSLTKYVAGHGNVLGGAVIDTGVFNWRSFKNINEAYQVADTQQWGLTQIRKKGLRDIGGTLTPSSAHTIATGLETLTLRLDRSMKNALCLAEFLDQLPSVKAVNYPGLATHPQHDIASSSFSEGYGALLSVDLADHIDPVEFLNALKLVICATHLGDTRTLALPVAPTIFFEDGLEARKSMGISETLIRISVGIEDIEDLISDFKQAFAQFG